MRRWLSAPALVLVLLAFVGGRSEAEPVPTVTVDANPSVSGTQSSNTVFVSTSTSVDVLVGSVSDLRAFNFELVYDQTKLSAPTISTGSDLDRNPDANQSFLTSTGRTWSCSPPPPSGDTDPSPTVGVAFISCFSSGAPAGPGAGSAGEVIARVQFDAVAPGSSALTLRNVNTFKAGGAETGSCNPVVVVAATCTGATLSVISEAVGGIAELPQIGGAAATRPDPSGRSGQQPLIIGLATAAFVLALAGAAYRVRRTKRSRGPER